MRSRRRPSGELERLDAFDLLTNDEERARQWIGRATVSAMAKAAGICAAAIVAAVLLARYG